KKDEKKDEKKEKDEKKDSSRLKPLYGVNPRTVRNRLFMTVLGHSLHTAVSTAVWRECHRTVRNRLFLTVLGHSFHTAVETLHLFVSINGSIYGKQIDIMFQPLYGGMSQ
ncbi:unnamed protein product, partial [Staurois parvus]